jgi:sulfur-carrier protein
MQTEQGVGQPMRPPSPQVAAVTVRYWAGARAAAGADSDQVRAASVAEAISQVNVLHPGLAQVTAVCSLLLDGRPAAPDQPLVEGSVLEVLPPFAGG